MTVDLYIKKHRVIQDYLKEISGYIQSGTLDNAAAISDALNKMSGVLKMHLASEDESLYPTLLASKDAHVRIVTKSYMEEMGDLAKSYTEFATAFNTPSKIASNPSGFETKFEKIKYALHFRINREEKELYKLEP